MGGREQHTSCLCSLPQSHSPEQIAALSPSFLIHAPSLAVPHPYSALPSSPEYQEGPSLSTHIQLPSCYLPTPLIACPPTVNTYLGLWDATPQDPLYLYHEVSGFAVYWYEASSLYAQEGCKGQMV